MNHWHRLLVPGLRLGLEPIPWESLANSCDSSVIIEMTPPACRSPRRQDCLLKSFFSLLDLRDGMGHGSRRCQQDHWGGDSLELGSGFRLVPSV